MDSCSDGWRNVGSVLPLLWASPISAFYWHHQRQQPRGRLHHLHRLPHPVLQVPHVQFHRLLLEKPDSLSSSSFVSLYPVTCKNGRRDHNWILIIDNLRLVIHIYMTSDQFGYIFSGNRNHCLSRYEVCYLRTRIESSYYLGRSCTAHHLPTIRRSILLPCISSPQKVLMVIHPAHQEYK